MEIRLCISPWVTTVSFPGASLLRLDLSLKNIRICHLFRKYGTRIKIFCSRLDSICDDKIIYFRLTLSYGANFYQRSELCLRLAPIHSRFFFTEIVVQYIVSTYLPFSSTLSRPPYHVNISVIMGVSSSSLLTPPSIQFDPVGPQAFFVGLYPAFLSPLTSTPCSMQD